MKRQIIVFLFLVFTLSFAACSNVAASKPDASTQPSQIQTESSSGEEVITAENPELPRTLSQQEKSDLQTASDFGIADSSLWLKLDEPISQYDATRLILNANNVHFGQDHSKYLSGILKSAGLKTDATRYWIAQNIYYSQCEVIYGESYTDPESWIQFCDEKGEPPELFPDATYVLVRQDGTVGEMDGWESITDNSLCWGENVSDDYKWGIDFGNVSVPHYVIMMYDRTTGEKVMSLDDEQAFHPQDTISVKDAILTALRYYRSFPEKAVKVSYDEVLGYDKNIITAELLDKQSALPDCSNQFLPQWKGQMVPCMMHPTKTANDRDTDDIITETDIKIISEAGFNFVGLDISFTSLQDPFYQSGMVNKSQLEYLDQILAWCIQYDIHLEIRCATPPCTDDWAQYVDDFSKIESMSKEMFTNNAIRDEFTAFWRMLARRYSEIPNKYLDFNLMNEPEANSESEYVRTYQPAIEAIRAESPDRCIVADIHSMPLTGEGMAELGVALSYHAYEPRSFCVLYEGQNDYTDDQLASVTWPYTDENGKTWNAEETLQATMRGQTNTISILDLKATAEENGVGFMVGEWGIFGTPPGQLLTKTYNRDVVYAFYSDVMATYAEQGIGWCLGNGWFGEYGIVTPYPAIEECQYAPLENSNMFVDTGMLAFYKAQLINN